MNLDVLIPSLFLPAQVQTMFSPPKVPALERLLARADLLPEAASDGTPWLCERWGVGAPYPVASLLAEQDGLDASNDGWMFAEPVSLVPDRDRLKLFPARFLDLQVAETASLISTLNSHFADRHLLFLAPTADRWYVRCAQSEMPGTTPPQLTRFGSLADFQPKSKGTLDWRSLQNEAQMLLFNHPVNEVREAEGRSPVSGVWFWGGGVMPELKKPAYDFIVSSLGLATQLAQKTGINMQALSWDSVSSTSGNVLAVIESCVSPARNNDFQAWSHELERLDREWFQPVSQAFRKGVVQHLNIYAPDPECARSFQLTRLNQLLRFWRPTKPLSTYA